MAPTVMGLDLSMTSTGIAVFVHNEAETYTVKSKGSRDATWEQRSLRLRQMTADILSYVQFYSPDLIVVEAPSYGSNLPGKHDTSGLWWMVVSELASRRGCAYVAPKARAKYGTGNGNSGKDVVEAFARQFYQDLCKNRFRNNDECDAVLLAAMGMRWLGWEVEPHPLHPDNLDAMEKVAWPV